MIAVAAGCGAGGDEARGLPQLCGVHDYAESAAANARLAEVSHGFYSA